MSKALIHSHFFGLRSKRLIFLLEVPIHNSKTASQIFSKLTFSESRGKLGTVHTLIFIKRPLNAYTKPQQKCKHNPILHQKRWKTFVRKMQIFKILFWPHFSTNFAFFGPKLSFRLWTFWISTFTMVFFASKAPKKGPESTHFWHFS